MDSVRGDNSSGGGPTGVTALEPVALPDFDRQHLEDPHPLFSEFQRDRLRVLHCQSFQRLDGKSHAFLSVSGQRQRTRMAVAMAGASLARTMCHLLDMDADLAETIALARLLGAPPFARAGENALRDIMTPHGGFSVLGQSLRIVEVLEMEYPEFNGLNLTQKVRDGLWPASGVKSPPEGKVARVAEALCVWCHDLDSGLEAGFLDPQELEGLEIWREASKKALANFPNLDSGRRRKYVVRCLAQDMLGDFLMSNRREATGGGTGTLDFSQEWSALLRPLNDILHDRLYHHPDLRQAHRNGTMIMERLFEVFRRNPSLMGIAAVRRIKKDGVPRVVCDYLVGMTDAVAREAFSKLLGDDDPMRPMMGRG
jgi:dGTPase